MSENQGGRVFAQRGNDAAASDAASGNDATAGTPRTHARRTVGVTEQRLRDANRESWMTSRSGWATWFRRFMPGRG